MIKSLHIENIAVIEKTDIDFDKGFNVLTGETGAGKSIIIDAINAVLGERTSKDLIRAGCDKALVSALFCDLSEQSKKQLAESGFEPDPDGNLLITRALTLSGSSIKINGRPATAGVLKDVSKNLINIHGQHDNQKLLNPDNYYIYLDMIAENQKQLKDYYDEFKHFNAVRRELNANESDEGEKLRRIEILKYQINELEQADITVGEIDDIRSKLAVAENYEKTVSALGSAAVCIDGEENSDGALSLIKNAQNYIESTKNDRLSNLSDRLEEVLANLEAVGFEIRSFINNTEYSELDADKLRERLDTLRRLMLKYGGDVAVGAMTILTSVMQFAMLPLQGIAQGAQPISSYNYGAKNADRVKKTFRLLLIVCLSYSAILWAAVQLVPRMFVSIFTADTSLIDFTAPMLKIYLGGLFLFGIQIACQMTFTSLGKAVNSIIVAVVRKFVLLIPLIYIMPHMISDSTTGVYMAEPIADITAVIFTSVLFTFQFKKALAEIQN